MLAEVGLARRKGDDLEHVRVLAGVLVAARTETGTPECGIGIRAHLGAHGVRELVRAQAEVECIHWLNVSVPHLSRIGRKGTRKRRNVVVGATLAEPRRADAARNSV